MARHSRESGNPVFVCMFFSGFRPLGEVLFFAPPKKSTQKKGVTDGLPATRVPCASREDRRLRNSRSRCARLAQTGRKLNPVFTAMLGCANGIKVKTKDTNQKTATPNPSALTEYRRQSGIRRAPCLRQACLPSCARPRIGEERSASAPADECAGCPSLWALSLGQTRESASPRRAK